MGVSVCVRAVINLQLRKQQVIHHRHKQIGYRAGIDWLVVVVMVEDDNNEGNTFNMFSVCLSIIIDIVLYVSCFYLYNDNVGFAVMLLYYNVFCCHSYIQTTTHSLSCSDWRKRRAICVYNEGIVNKNKWAHVSAGT